MHAESRGGIGDKQDEARRRHRFSNKTFGLNRRSSSRRYDDQTLGQLLQMLPQRKAVPPWNVRGRHGPRLLVDGSDAAYANGREWGN